MRKAIRLTAAVLMILGLILFDAGCGPIGQSPTPRPDDRPDVVLPCSMAPGSRLTLVAETLTRQASLTRRPAILKMTGIDSDGNYGTDLTTGGPMNGSPQPITTPYCYSFVRVGPVFSPLHVSFTVTVNGGPGDILECYTLNRLGHEVAGSHQHAQAPAAAAAILTVTCLETVN